MKKLTKQRRKALKILRDNPNICASHFAELMWSDSPAWGYSHNCGNGATIGSGMWLCAGSYLAKLRKEGLVQVDLDRRTYQNFFSLTSKGKELLEEKNPE